MLINFFSVQEVIDIHNYTVERYGGAYGIRDQALLESAIAQPEMILFGSYIHEDIWHMAAAYAFHIIKNHPFIDGNKRAGTLTAI